MLPFSQGDSLEAGLTLSTKCSWYAACSVDSWTVLTLYATVADLSP